MLLYSAEDVDSTTKLYPSNPKIAERIVMKLESHLPNICDESEAIYTTPAKGMEHN